MVRRRNNDFCGGEVSSRPKKIFRFHGAGVFAKETIQKHFPETGFPFANGNRSLWNDSQLEYIKLVSSRTLTIYEPAVFTAVMLDVGVRSYNRSKFAEHPSTRSGLLAAKRAGKQTWKEETHFLKGPQKQKMACLSTAAEALWKNLFGKKVRRSMRERRSEADRRPTNSTYDVIAFIRPQNI